MRAVVGTGSAYEGRYWLRRAGCVQTRCRRVERVVRECRNFRIPGRRLCLTFVAGVSMNKAIRAIGYGSVMAAAVVAALPSQAAGPADRICSPMMVVVPQGY